MPAHWSDEPPDASLALLVIGCAPQSQRRPAGRGYRGNRRRVDGLRAVARRGVIAERAPLALFRGWRQARAKFALQNSCHPKAPDLRC